MYEYLGSVPSVLTSLKSSNRVNNSKNLFTNFLDFPDIEKFYQEQKLVVFVHLLHAYLLTPLSKSLYILRFEEATLDGSGCHSASVPSLFLILITRLFVFDKKSFISHANTANIGSSMNRKHNALAQDGYVVVVVDVSTPGETGEKSC